MKTELTNDEIRVTDIKTAATFSFFGAAGLITAFIYSFFVAEPIGTDGLFYILQKDHYEFFIGMRWYSLVIGIASLSVGAHHLLHTKELETN